MWTVLWGDRIVDLVDTTVIQARVTGWRLRWKEGESDGEKWDATFLYCFAKSTFLCPYKNLYYEEKNGKVFKKLDVELELGLDPTQSCPPLSHLLSSRVYILKQRLSKRKKFPFVSTSWHYYWMIFFSTCHMLLKFRIYFLCSLHFTWVAIITDVQLKLKCNLWQIKQV